MSETYIFEGSTTNEAIEKGLKELKVSRNQVEIKVLDENKRSFFSILAPRIVKVELTLKNNSNNKRVVSENSIPVKHVKREIVISEEDIKKAEKLVNEFIRDFIEKLNLGQVEYTVKNKDNLIKIDFKGEELKLLIGYRGETLNSLENIINAILLNNKIHLRVSCNINSYREKRIQTLNELADKVSKTVIKTGRNVTLDPMPAYERKIIHTRLQNSNKVKTYSVGEGARRRLVISLK